MGDAFRLLGTAVGGQEGAETIAAITRHAVNVFEIKGQAEFDGQNIGLDASGPVDGIAARLGHEGEHVIEYHSGSPAPYPKQEVKAWNRALNVFDRSTKQDPFYRIPSQRRAQNQQKFDQKVERCALTPKQPCQM